MRLAYVCADPGVPVFGRKGASVHVMEVLRALRQYGAEVVLFANRLGGDPPAGLEDIRLHRLQPLPPGPAAAREQAALDLNEALSRQLEQSEPYDMVYERYSLWSYAAMQYARFARIPGVLEINAPLIEEQIQHRQLIRRRDAQRVRARAFGCASTLVAVSPQVGSYVRQFARTAHRVHVVPNGVDPESFGNPVAPRWPSADGTFTIGFVGSLKPWHGLDLLLDAFELLHRRDGRWRLLVVGDGPERLRLAARLAASPPPVRASVNFTGAVAHDAVPGYLASMQVAVAPYPNLKEFYFSPLKVFEYMAAGLPVVASRIGQLAELVQDGETGVLCPPGDAPAMAQALEQLRGDAELRRRLGERARQTVREHYTWRAAVSRILQAAGVPAPLCKT